MLTEKSVVLRLIKLYKEMPFLWNKDHKDYKNRQKRNQGHRQLLQVIREIDPSATLKISRKKIENLRTNYIKELKKVLDAQRSNTDYVPNLYYYKELEFLNDHTDMRITTLKDRQSLDHEGHSSRFSSDADSDYQRAFVLSTQKKPYPPSNTSIAPQEFGIECDRENRDEKWETIGRSIGLQLRDMDKVQRTVAHKLINDVIYYAESGLLSHNASISLYQDAMKYPTEYDNENRDSKDHIIKIHDPRDNE